MTVDEVKQTLADVKASLLKNKEALTPILPKLNQIAANMALNPSIWITVIKLLGGSEDDAMGYLDSSRKILEIEHKLVDTDLTDRLIKIIDFMYERNIILHMIAPLIKDDGSVNDNPNP